MPHRMPHGAPPPHTPDAHATQSSTRPPRRWRGTNWPHMIMTNIYTVSAALQTPETSDSSCYFKSSDPMILTTTSGFWRHLLYHLLLLLLLRHFQSRLKKNVYKYNGVHSNRNNSLTCCRKRLPWTESEEWADLVWVDLLSNQLNNGWNILLNEVCTRCVHACWQKAAGFFQCIDDLFLTSTDRNTSAKHDWVEISRV